MHRFLERRDDERAQGKSRSSRTVIVTWQTGSGELWQGASPHHVPLHHEHRLFDTEAEALGWLNWDPSTVRDTYIDITSGNPDVVVADLHIYFLGRELHAYEYNPHIYVEERFGIKLEDYLDD